MIRDASADDVAAICEVLRASIAELCVADHRGDPDILGRWLANKQPDIVAGWVADPASSLLIAVAADAIMAVGGVRNDGEITLNYVSPKARFRGVSSAMLAALERRAAERGNARCRLLSTETAHQFYLSRGYADDGAPQGKFGTNSSYPMSRNILSRNITPR